jgi:hypothetical protein
MHGQNSRRRDGLQRRGLRARTAFPDRLVSSDVSPWVAPAGSPVVEWEKVVVRAV